MPNPELIRRRLQKKVEKFVKGLPMGEFQGKFNLQWIGPNLFQYTPDAHDPFRYLRKNDKGEVIETITPKPMDTDGGSIPQIAQLIPGLSPWEYGPAYMIHDWEFEAHDLAQILPDFTFDKSFEEVNLTLAEAIWTLMNKGYLDYPKPAVNVQNVHKIYWGVMSPFGREIWDDV